MKKSSSSFEKKYIKTRVCTDINDISFDYWDISDLSAYSDFPGSYWEDTVSTINARTMITRPVLNSF